MVISARLLLQQGKPEEALPWCSRRLTSQFVCRTSLLCYSHWTAESEAETALNSLVRDWADTAAYFVAKVYAYRGEPDLALEWLERAYRQKDSTLIEIVGEHLFKDLAEDPRFTAFLRKMNLPQDTRLIDLKVFSK